MFLNLNLIIHFDYVKLIKKFSPIFIFIIIFSFCNPAIINHIDKALTSQDYSLSKVNMENTNNFDSIIKLLDNDKNPIVYIEEGRYLNTFLQKVKN